MYQAAKHHDPDCSAEAHTETSHNEKNVVSQHIALAPVHIRKSPPNIRPDQPYFQSLSTLLISFLSFFFLSQSGWVQCHRQSFTMLEWTRNLPPIQNIDTITDQDTSSTTCPYENVQSTGKF